MGGQIQRVLHVLNQFDRSGAEMMLLQSAGQWRERGYALDLLATGPQIGPLAASLQQAGFAVHHIPFRSRLRYLPSREFIPRFMRLCRGAKYDVLHLHTEAAMLLFVMLGRAAGIPTIVRTVHNAFTFRGALRARKRAERSIGRALGVRFAFVSESVEQVEAEYYNNPGVHTPNWFDVEHFRPPSAEERAEARRALECAEDAVVLVTLGNCNHAKNHTALMEALAVVETPRRLIYLHVGREQPGAPERGMAAGLGLEDRVRFMGSHADPRPFLWGADLFVMPSLYEGLGNAALEAVGAGAPALFTNVRGLRDIAAKARWIVQADPTAASLACGLSQALAVAPAVARERARLDSAAIHRAYAIGDGVGHIVGALYRDPGLRVSELAGTEEAHAG